VPCSHHVTLQLCMGSNKPELMSITSSVSWMSSRASIATIMGTVLAFQFVIFLVGAISVGRIDRSFHAPQRKWRIAGRRLDDGRNARLELIQLTLEVILINSGLFEPCKVVRDRGDCTARSLCKLPMQTVIPAVSWAYVLVYGSARYCTSRFSCAISARVGQNLVSQADFRLCRDLQPNGRPHIGSAGRGESAGCVLYARSGTPSHPACSTARIPPWGNMRCSTLPKTRLVQLEFVGQLHA